jgi:hypothetical protein
MRNTVSRNFQLPADRGLAHQLGVHQILDLGVQILDHFKLADVGSALRLHLALRL